MGEYGFDTIVRTLELGTAEEVYASSTELFPDCYPVASTLHYRFPERPGKPAVEVNWYDGGIKPERPAGMSPDVDMSVGGEGVMYSGERGRLLTAFMGQAPPRLLSPKGDLARSWQPLAPANQPFEPSRPELGPSATAADNAHYLEWIKACHGGPPASTNYEFEEAHRGEPDARQRRYPHPGTVAVGCNRLSPDPRLGPGFSPAEASLSPTLVRELMSWLKLV